MSHIKRMQRAHEVAKRYRKENAAVGSSFDGGFVVLWKLKPDGWTCALDRPWTFRPGVLLVAESGAVWMATGGEYQTGAKEFTNVWDCGGALK